MNSTMSTTSARLRPNRSTTPTIRPPAATFKRRCPPTANLGGSTGGSTARAFPGIRGTGDPLVSAVSACGGNAPGWNRTWFGGAVVAREEFERGGKQEGRDLTQWAVLVFDTRPRRASRG